jgi:exoribonuclease-2
MSPNYSEPNHRKHLRKIARRVMKERGMLCDFSAEVDKELQAAPDRAEEPTGDRRDLRRMLWSSIDNDDSQDLDQLTVAEMLPDGAIRIGVAVADVDAVVRKGGAVDRHARHNTTSVYTAAQVYPMIPEQLCYDLTSLNMDEDRAAMVVLMDVDAEGHVSAPDICLALVRNHAKLAYDAVAAWLDDMGPRPQHIGEVPGLEENLRLQDEAAQRLRRRRFDHGALTLETIQSRPVFADEQISALQVDERNRAKDLIEDFMIAANGVTAQFLEKRKRDSLRRLVREPKRWERIVDVAAALGHHLPVAPDSKALSEFLDERHVADPVSFPDLSLTIVKLLGRGEYMVKAPGVEAPGHFGLAVHDYAHSTAPNRRYPDLITLRLVKSALQGGKPPYSTEDLKDLASHCTRKEDDANKVERLVAKSAAAMVIQSRVGERFEGIITGASEKGTWVRVFDPPVEGKLSNGESELDVGDHVRVELKRVDIERGYIDFTLVHNRPS